MLWWYVRMANRNTLCIRSNLIEIKLDLAYVSLFSVEWVQDDLTAGSSFELSATTRIPFLFNVDCNQQWCHSLVTWEVERNHSRRRSGGLWAKWWWWWWMAGRWRITVDHLSNGNGVTSSQKHWHYWPEAKGTGRKRWCQTHTIM